MNKHDKIATRLSLILTKLNNGERLSVEDLAKELLEFKISEVLNHISNT